MTKTEIIQNTMPKKENRMKYKLCYVEPRGGSEDDNCNNDPRSILALYFTPCPIMKVWGDDWDDTPYEHNAGTPYSEYKCVMYKMFATDNTEFILPDRGRDNSAFSVKQINANETPWIIVDILKKSNKVTHTRINIWAGDIIEQVQKIWRENHIEFKEIKGAK